MFFVVHNFVYHLYQFEDNIFRHLHSELIILVVYIVFQPLSELRTKRTHNRCWSIKHANAFWRILNCKMQKYEDRYESDVTYFFS
jgi:hypothetical protein